MFYSTLYLKMGAYFRNSFELNTAEHKLLRFTIPYLEDRSIRAIEIAHTQSLAKQIGILFTYFLPHWLLDHPKVQ